MDINFKNDALALVGIKSTDPEIVGTDSMDLNIEIPVGETPVKVSFKATSTVASSIVAQERLNEIARDNINFLGSKIAEGISYLMDNGLTASMKTRSSRNNGDRRNAMTWLNKPCHRTPIRDSFRGCLFFFLVFP